MSIVQAVAWGDVPTWIGAVTTALALVAAGAVVFIELRRDKDTRARLERSEQADRVAAWEDWDKDRPIIRLRNGSDLPIYGVILWLTRAPGYGKPELRDVRLTVVEQPVVPPGDLIAMWPSDVFTTTNLGDTRLDERNEWRISFGFFDTSGRAWERSPNGTLKRNRTWEWAAELGS